jgi:hypothetical protein
MISPWGVREKGIGFADRRPCGSRQLNGARELAGGRKSGPDRADPSSATMPSCVLRCDLLPRRRPGDQLPSKTKLVRSTLDICRTDPIEGSQRLRARCELMERSKKCRPITL